MRIETVRPAAAITLGVTLLLCAEASASAQSAMVNVGSQKQYIRGFGGMSHAAWIGDMTAAERNLAFGNGDGQLGFTLLRIPVTDGAPNSANVATAKAAIAAGAIVLATPWNAAGTYGAAQFPAYATHLNDFVVYMKNQGVDLYAISVQNEPDFGKQAGWGSWTAAACHDFIVNYGAMISTKLMSCESFSYNKTYYDPILNDPAALANTGVFGTHLYGTALNNYPYPAFDQKGAGKERWMTEHYTDSTSDADAWPNALGVATEIHHAMADAQFNAYIWWYIVRSYGPIKAPGTATKRGWCMAQFSKFIRPGYYRVDATASPMSGVFMSAYKGASDVVVVIVNTTAAAASLNVSINGATITSYDRFTTSASKSLSSDGKVTASNGLLAVTLDPQSVTTLHGGGSIISTGSGGATGSGGTGGSRGATGAGGSRTDGGAAGADAGSDASPESGGSGLRGTGGGFAGVGGARAGDDDGGTGKIGANDGCDCRIASDQGLPALLPFSGALVALAFASRRRRAGAGDQRRV